jgi:hypothetical protein
MSSALLSFEPIFQTGRTTSSRSAKLTCSEFVKLTLSKSPSTFHSLVYLADMCERTTAHYRDNTLQLTFGRQEVDRIVRYQHRLVLWYEDLLPAEHERMLFISDIETVFPLLYAQA